MPVTSPPLITALPPPPDPNNRSTFNTLAYPWSVAQQTFATQAGAVASNVYNNATSAVESANTATMRANTATTGADTATTKAGEALASANSAAAAFDSFDERYLGAKLSAPSVDNNGNPLIVGATYWSTGSNLMMGWTGTQWVSGFIAAGSEVFGPASSSDGHVALFDGTSGKLIKSSGVSLSSKQDVLVAGTNIKTIGGYSLLGAGNLSVSATIGDVIITARELSAPGYLPLSSELYLQSSYPALYSEIGLIPNAIGTYMKDGGNGVVGGAAAQYGKAVAWGGNKYFAYIGSSSTPYLSVFQRSGTTFTLIDSPWGITGGSRSCSMSADGKYVAATDDSSPYIHAWSISGTTLTKLPNPATLPSNVSYSCAWSPDGVYLAVGHDSAPYLTIYKLSGSTLTKLVEPASPPTSRVMALAWTNSGTRLACGTQSSPFIDVFSRFGDTFARLQSPAPQPDSAVTAVAWSQDGNHLATACGTTPYINVYKLSGSTLTKLNNPATLPTGSVKSLSWFDSTNLIFANANGGISYYEFNADVMTMKTVSSIIQSSLSSVVYGLSTSPDGIYTLVAYDSAQGLRCISNPTYGITTQFFLPAIFGVPQGLNTYIKATE